MGSETHYVGGTLDVVAKVDEELELIDWKTSKRLSDDVFLQTASYKMMLLEGGVEKISRRAVRLDKTGKGFEDYPIKSDYFKDRDAFLALLKNYRWNRDIKQAFFDKFGNLKVNNK